MGGSAGFKNAHERQLGRRSERLVCVAGDFSTIRRLHDYAVGRIAVPNRTEDDRSQSICRNGSLVVEQSAFAFLKLNTKFAVLRNRCFAFVVCLFEYTAH